MFFLGEQELNNTMRLTMYPTIIKDLFGERVLHHLNDEESIKVLTEKFVQFDDQFEYGTQIPQIFLRCVGNIGWNRLYMIHNNISYEQFLCINCWIVFLYF